MNTTTQTEAARIAAAGRSNAAIDARRGMTSGE